MFNLISNPYNDFKRTMLERVSIVTEDKDDLWAALNTP